MARYNGPKARVNRRLGTSAAFRLNGMWQDAGYPGRDVQKNKSWGFAPTLSVGLTGPTRVTVSYSRLQQDNVPDLGTKIADKTNRSGVAERCTDPAVHTSVEGALALLD